MGNEEKKIIGYNPHTGEPIFEGQEIPKEKKNISKLIITIVIIVLALGVGTFLIYNAVNKKQEPTIKNEKKVFTQKAYEIPYKSPWKIEKGILNYKKDKIELIPRDSTILDESTKEALKSPTGKFNIYNEFREYWGKTNNISNGTGTFYTLKEELYYASIDYTTRENHGKIYELISTDSNMVLSFMTVIDINKSTADKEVLKLLKNINVKTTEDDKMPEYLDTMTNWNSYKKLRSDEIGKKKTIEGEWRILSNSEEYIKITNGEFYSYNSFKNLNDNYTVGTYKKYTGKKGATKVGIDEYKIENIISKNKGIKEKDIYTIIVKPNKLISEGTDKTDTLNKEDINTIWILVDHGKEGIEAQKINVATKEITHYVKIKD